MKKKLLLPIYFCINSLAIGQVGINLPSPNPNADLELGSKNRALLLNRVPNTGAINNPVNGMLIYDVSEDCVKAYQGNAWSQCFWKDNPAFTLTCNSAAFVPPTATQGQSYSGTLTIPYTNGDGSSYPGQSIGPNNGLIATLAPGTFNTGPGILEFAVNGYPVNSGSAVFDITVNGSRCSAVSITVNPGTPVIPPNITLEGRYFIASIIDQDYSPFTKPTAPATTARPVAADGVNETLVDLQGVIPASGLTVYIPATATGNGTIGAWSQTINVPANLTEDGISRNITLSWSSQSYNTSTKTITATLKAEGGTLNARKLDINAGIGNDYLGVLLGKFLMPNQGTQKGYEVRIIAGIPDRMFNLPDNNGVFNHNFLYLPVQAEDGNIWLNNNLGADYTNTQSPSFNIAKQAASATDFKAFGSLFQWGRKPDGHDLITWTNADTGTGVYGTTNVQADEPVNPLFILFADWRVTMSGTLWQNGSSANNPCPVGFKVPAQSEWINYTNRIGNGGADAFAASKLALSAAGYRQNNFGTVNSTSATKTGRYWTSTSTITPPSPSSFVITIPGFGGGVSSSGADKALGHSVRCIKE